MKEQPKMTEEEMKLIGMSDNPMSPFYYGEVDPWIDWLFTAEMNVCEHPVIDSEEWASPETGGVGWCCNVCGSGERHVFY